MGKLLDSFKSPALRRSLIAVVAALVVVIITTILLVTTFNKGKTKNSQSLVTSTNSPSSVPTVSLNPSMSPTINPTQTLIPSSTPTLVPSLSHSPSSQPSATPTTDKPSTTPSSLPSLIPTSNPSNIPSNRPSSIPTLSPSSNPSSFPSVTPSLEPTSSVKSYIPGNLTTLKLGLLLSEGLDCRELANSGDPVKYDNGKESSILFHEKPDGAATFADTRPENKGGWVYVSNSEVPDGQGGVGAITFDKDGNVIDYRMLLEDTSMNCSGGRTPWGTWVSCEEVEFTGQVYQVDPIGERDSELMTIGAAGGRWEAFAYDIRNEAKPRFFITEDHNKGTVRRFTPDNPDWDSPWEMLTGPGIVDYMMVFPNEANNGGTIQWTNDLKAAKDNARSYYPQTEGIDVYKNELVIVCKNIRQVFTVDLDAETYTNQTSVSGLFDGKPDQMQRILDSPRDLLYFTEEGGKDAGVHARDYNGRFYSILESPIYSDETSGLAFSPDGKHMYVAYQATGKLFDVWRIDGHPFHYDRLNVKYHQPDSGR